MREKITHVKHCCSFFSMYLFLLTFDVATCISLSTVLVSPLTIRVTSYEGSENQYILSSVNVTYWC